ncbi:RNF167_3 [Blepharisma stoltei]|uniref:RING-type domain-containing protein n=1 Tax=Blepharisma stoltei TaxID=1481888 RepID=A0AAU9JS14_9CILI|nr:unnamed protein product [Blepharisma stoltei]
MIIKNLLINKMANSLIIMLALLPISISQYSYSNCPCSTEQLHNKKCDQECNTSDCNWDNDECSSNGGFEYVQMMVILGAAVGFIATFLFLCFVSVRLKLFSNLRSLGPTNPSENHVTKEQITEEVPPMNFSEDTKYSGEPVCTICLTDFKNGDVVRITKCMHIFHSKCIEEWLLSTNHPKCPDCNKIYVFHEFFQ